MLKRKYPYVPFIPRARYPRRRPGGPASPGPRGRRVFPAPGQRCDRFGLPDLGPAPTARTQRCRGRPDRPRRVRGGTGDHHGESSADRLLRVLPRRHPEAGSVAPDASVPTRRRAPGVSLRPGATAARTAHRLGIPVVAVYQTDVAGFADRYGMTRWRPILERRLRGIHRLADRTLAPSHISRRQLKGLGVPRVHYWPRGVDLELFSPEKRSEAR